MSSLLGGPVKEVWLSSLALNANCISALNAVLQVRRPLRGSRIQPAHAASVYLFSDMHFMQKDKLICKHFVILYGCILLLNSFDPHILWFSNQFLFFLSLLPLISLPPLCSLSEGSRPGTRVPALWRRPVQWKLPSKHSEKDTRSLNVSKYLVTTSKGSDSRLKLGMKALFEQVNA